MKLLTWGEPLSTSIAWAQEPKTSLAWGETTLTTLDWSKSLSIITAWGIPATAHSLSFVAGPNNLSIPYVLSTSLKFNLPASSQYLVLIDEI